MAIKSAAGCARWGHFVVHLRVCELGSLDNAKISRQELVLTSQSYRCGIDVLAGVSLQYSGKIRHVKCFWLEVVQYADDWVGDGWDAGGLDSSLL